MAAWVESDPWNLWPGLPSGHLGPTAPLGRSSWPSMPWSNLAATLAYSDKYAWTWSEKTNYPATALRLIRFSLRSRTRPSTREPRRSGPSRKISAGSHDAGLVFRFQLHGDRRTEPPDDGPPQMVMTTDAVAYAWSPTDRAVQVRGHWTCGEFGEIEGLAVPQRRRYVRPITPLTQNDDIRMESDFTVEDFGQDAANPILLGLFHNEAATDSRDGLCSDCERSTHHARHRRRRASLVPAAGPRRAVVGRARLSPGGRVSCRDTVRLRDAYRPVESCQGLQGNRDAACHGRAVCARRGRRGAARGGVRGDRGALVPIPTRRFPASPAAARGGRQLNSRTTLRRDPLVRELHHEQIHLLDVVASNPVATKGQMPDGDTLRPDEGTHVPVPWGLLPDSIQFVRRADEDPSL